MPPVSSYPGAYDPRYPYYDPNNSYGWEPGMAQWQNDPMNAQFIYGEQNPDAPWTAELAKRGFGGQDARSMWAQSQQGKAYAGYGAARMNNLNYTWQDHLKNFAGNLDRMWLEASPSIRGDNDQAYSPSMRWQMRP